MGAEADRVVLDGIHCRYEISRPSDTRALVVISGSDIGEFGDAPMVKLQEKMRGCAPLELFIDARDVRGASIEVSHEWARWLSGNRAQFARVNMLTGSRYIEMTAEFVRRFAGLQDVMRIYTQPADFDQDLGASP